MLRNLFHIFGVMLVSWIALTQEALAVSPKSDGIVFKCTLDEMPLIKKDMAEYLRALNIQMSWVVVKEETDQLQFSLITAEGDTDTLTLHSRREFGIVQDIVELPGAAGRTRRVATVSKKEIVLSLLQHGRSTVFSGELCSVTALQDHVLLRQNIVAWGQRLEWNWPDGGAAYWNKKFWKRGSLHSSALLVEALRNAFLEQSKYAIGCYTASKLVIVQGVVDFYARIKKDSELTKVVINRLLRDKEPLVNIEPGKMWYFEEGVQAEELGRGGKLLELMEDIPHNNFVPGDWSYFLNTDKKTYEKTGYEGSNAIYLGGGKFDDYYNDNNHSYSFDEKIDEVYQWRHGVFSRKRDAAKIHKLSPKDFSNLSNSPSFGGLLLTYRAVPLRFGKNTAIELDLAVK